MNIVLYTSDVAATRTDLDSVYGSGGWEHRYTIWPSDPTDWTPDLHRFDYDPTYHAAVYMVAIMLAGCAVRGRVR